jgi:hypothetical protein
MDDANQIQVPDSFLALFASRGGLRLTEPIAHVRARYELCEDLAQALTEQARLTQFQLGITEQYVLEKMLQPNEAQWVVRRLAELLDWPPLTDDLAR